MNERNLEQEKLDGEVPKELQNELNKMQRRERFYTFAVAGALSLALLFGFNWYRAQQGDYVPFSYNNAVGNVSNSGGGVFSGGGGCCSTGGASTAPADLGTVEQQGLTYYQQTYKDADVTAEAKDYGCHIQCDIVKDGEVIKSFSYRDGQLSEI